MSAGISLALSLQRADCSVLTSVTCRPFGTFYSFLIFKSSNLSRYDLEFRLMTFELQHEVSLGLLRVNCKCTLRGKQYQLASLIVDKVKWWLNKLGCQHLSLTSF